jgi:FixJ family two-component response regulator
MRSGLLTVRRRSWQLCRAVARIACAIIDLRMPGMDGIAAASPSSAGAALALPVIFLTGHGEIPMSVRAMKGGAVDFLTKAGHVWRRLLKAVRYAALRECDRLKLRNSTSGPDGARPAWDALTRREREIMALAVAGTGQSKEIARRLGISHRTVEQHRGTRHEKDGCRLPWSIWSGLPSKADWAPAEQSPPRAVRIFPRRLDTPATYRAWRPEGAVRRRIACHARLQPDVSPARRQPLCPAGEVVGLRALKQGCRRACKPPAGGATLAACPDRSVSSDMRQSSGSSSA